MMFGMMMTKPEKAADKVKGDTPLPRASEPTAIDVLPADTFKSDTEHFLPE